MWVCVSVVCVSVLWVCVCKCENSLPLYACLDLFPEREVVFAGTAPAVRSSERPVSRCLWEREMERAGVQAWKQHAPVHVPWTVAWAWRGVCRYCPSCKEQREASKQMSVWRLPHTLVIQLKRFSFRNALWRDKIDKLVEFPIRWAVSWSPLALLLCMAAFQLVLFLWLCSFSFCLCAPSPWYNHAGWLGVKHWVAPLLVCICACRCRHKRSCVHATIPHVLPRTPTSTHTHTHVHKHACTPFLYTNPGSQMPLLFCVFCTPIHLYWAKCVYENYPHCTEMNLPVQRSTNRTRNDAASVPQTVIYKMTLLKICLKNNNLMFSCHHNIMSV